MATTEKQGVATLAESPTSGFTAVNIAGRDHPATLPAPIVTNGNPPSRRGSDERSNGRPRITPPGQEKLTITTTATQREDWLPPMNDRPPYQQSSAYSDTDSSHKRKRSGSIDPKSSSTNSYHIHALPSSTKETPTTATTESDGPRDELLRGRSQSDSRDPHKPDYRPFMSSAEESTPGGESWQNRQYPQPYPSTEEALGQILQGVSHSMDSQHHHDYDTSPGDDDRSANPYTFVTNDRREMSAQSDPKKRKRNFSNRTKTGCMTCRRRKKKCDETRPECKPF